MCKKEKTLNQEGIKRENYLSQIQRIYQQYEPPSYLVLTGS
ncbi:MAG: hypothetical protein N2482_00625 [Patescibacteria group bacterium]|nr:hypothetical protein [Patescibacteria group bacterium]